MCFDSFTMVLKVHTGTGGYGRCDCRMRILMNSDKGYFRGLQILPIVLILYILKIISSPQKKIYIIKNNYSGISILVLVIGEGTRGTSGGQTGG